MVWCEPSLRQYLVETITSNLSSSTACLDAKCTHSDWSNPHPLEVIVSNHRSLYVNLNFAGDCHHFHLEHVPQSWQALFLGLCSAWELHHSLEQSFSQASAQQLGTRLQSWQYCFTSAEYTSQRFLSYCSCNICCQHCCCSSVWLCLSLSSVTDKLS